eukprot:Tamp_03015.p4 GENE.Tamp_03015~~Tamp_03015.p4  ORF type:complete len:154 (-),score=8.81 Tamp_03015:2023-2484(-)
MCIQIVQSMHPGVHAHARMVNAFTCLRKRARILVGTGPTTGEVKRSQKSAWMVGQVSANWAQIIWAQTHHSRTGRTVSRFGDQYQEKKLKLTACFGFVAAIDSSAQSLIENFFFLSILHFFSNSRCSGLLVTASANNAFPTSALSKYPLRSAS